MLQSFIMYVINYYVFFFMCKVLQSGGHRWYFDKKRGHNVLTWLQGAHAFSEMKIRPL